MRSLLVGRDHVGCLEHDPTKEAFISLTSKVISASALRQRHSPLSPTLSHPAACGHPQGSPLRRAPPCSGARQRGCCAARGAREEPPAGGAGGRSRGGGATRPL